MKMDFAETEDQTMIRGMVRVFAESTAGPVSYTHLTLPTIDRG